MNGRVEQAQLAGRAEEGPKDIDQHECTEDSILSLIEESKRPLDWAFEEFIVQRDQVMIAGPAKAGKTFLAMQLALAAASGGKFLRWNASRSFRTCYVNMEVGRRAFAGRVVKQIGGEEQAGRYSDFFSASNVCSFDVLKSDSGATSSLRSRLQRYEFIVVDVLGRCHCANESDNSEMKFVMQALRQLAPEATMVVVHHHRKSAPGEERANPGALGIRGASAILGEVDLAVTLAVRSGRGARFSLKFAARNIGDPGEIVLDRDNATMLYHERAREAHAPKTPGTPELGGSGGSGRPSPADIRRAVLDAMNGQKVVAASELKQRLCQTFERGERTVQRYVEHACNENWLKPVTDPSGRSYEIVAGFEEVPTA